MPSTTEAPEGRALGGEPPAGEAEEEDFEASCLWLFHTTRGTGRRFVAFYHEQPPRILRTEERPMLTSSAGCGWACWTGRWRAIDWWVERTRPPTGGFVITGSARGILPYGPSLVSAAHDLFSFVSAGEGPPQATAEEAPLDSRVKGIEDAVLGLRGGLEALREELQHRNLGGPADAQNLAGPSRGPARPKAKGAIPGLDAAVLASARAAGIPEEQLVKMGELASRAGKLGDGARAKASILSESEEEDVPGAGGAEESSPGNVSEAICKISRRVCRSRLERVLERRKLKSSGLSEALHLAEGRPGQDCLVGAEVDV